MRYALSIIGLLALYWCLINLAAVWRAHVEQRRRAMKRHPTSCSCGWIGIEDHTTARHRELVRRAHYEENR